MSMQRKHRRLILACVVVVVAALAAAACSDDNSGGGDEAKSDPNGVLRWGLNFGGVLTQDKWNPAVSRNQCEQVVFEQIFATLLRVDDNGKIRAGLAEKWRMVDPSTVELVLYPNQKFHNGDPFNAAAVKAGLDYMKKTNDPGGPGGHVVGLKDVATVTAVDDKTVRITTATPTASSLLYQLTTRAGMIVHSTQISGSTKPIGAGPFMFVSYTPSANLSLKRFDDYREPMKLGGLEIVHVASGGVTALRSGSIDTVGAGGAELDPIRNDPIYKIDTTNSMSIENMVLKTKRPELANVKVRQALNHAVNKEDVRKVGGSGFDEELAYMPFPSGHAGYVAELKNKYPYDPAKARQLLTEAGYPNGFTFELTYASSNPGYVREAEVVQAQLTAVGIKVTMQPAPDTPSILRLFFEGAAGSGFSAITQGYFDPAEQLVDKYGPTSYLATTTGNSNPQITALVRQYQADPDKNQKALQDATRIVVDQALNLPYYFKPGAIVWNSDKIGGTINAPMDVCATPDFAQAFAKAT